MGCGSKERDFSFWMPVELVRGGEQPRIGGIASDETAADLQGEKVLIDGLDISYLTQRGTFNWDHGKNPGDIIGEIDTARKEVGDKRQLYVEGFLYPKVEKAKEVVNLLSSLKEAKSERKLGLSLEGKIRERDGADGKVVKKAWIRNVAVTYHPINQGTWVDFVKSLGDFKFEKCTVCPLDCPGNCPEKEPEPVKKSEEEPKKEEVKVEPKTESVPDFGIEKSDPMSPPPGVGLSAGHDNPGSSGGISGSALRRQSLEKDKKVTTYTEKDLGLKKKKKKKIKKSELIESIKERGFGDKESALMADFMFKAVELVPKEYKRSEIVEFLKSRKGYSDSLAEKMTDLIFKARTMI